MCDRIVGSSSELPAPRKTESVEAPAIEPSVRSNLIRLGRGVTQTSGSIPGRHNMKVGARNRIIGKVKDIKKGGVMCLVKLGIPASSTMASVMTLESLKELGIKKGDKVEVIVKAVNVLVMKN